MIADLLADLQSLYASLPAVGCRGCGRCCVSPSCTLAEFLFLMRDIRTHLSEEELRAFLHNPPRMSAEHEGNLVCRLLDGSRCAAHPARTGACRLFGTSAARDRGIADLVVCFHGIEDDNSMDPAQVQTWLDRLMELNGRIYPVHGAPYFLVGLNLECWLDIYFDASLNFDIFLPIRQAMLETIDLSSHAEGYVPRTGIREKIDKVTILDAMMDSVGADVLRDLLLSIRDGYPLTGTWFHDEAQIYLDEIGRGDNPSS